MINHIARTAPVLLLFACASAGAGADPPAVMFRGNPEHTGVSSARFFSGQGGVKWQVRTGGAVRSSPAVTDTRVFVGSGDGNLYALDRTNGRVVWRFDAGGAVDASPAVANGIVVAATLQGRIFAVDENSGGLRWSLQTGPALPVNTSPAGGWDLWASSPVIVGSTVVIGAPDGGVYSLDLATAVTQALALNRDSMATAWVRSYRRDRPGSGYVQLWGLGANLERLPAIRAAAEYGLLRKLEVRGEK